MHLDTLQQSKTFDVEAFKSFYKDCARLPVDDLDQIYDEGVIFQDPVHRLQGINELHAYLSNLVGTLKECRFEYLDQMVCSDRAFIKWDMHYRHRQLGNKGLTLRGVSQIHFRERITYHEDIYDLGQMIYEHVPLIGPGTRWLKNRLRAAT